MVEQSLSVDNLFVFLVLFNYFKVPAPYQGRVLTWGIIGSMVMRALMVSLTRHWNAGVQNRSSHFHCQ